ncbi:dipeptidase [Terriglobus roseus]|uniref:Membrane dipeptidase n=1 Tax=Terriglobus roseus TaxID=392734 RepID=A0A1H4KAM7_9BACT|nr:dipeptidase [Terriglobus roseus]SEB55589.1 membrane dipeptidase [Terriglobus roseus]
MEDFLTQARELHAECIVLDGHADTPQRFVDDNWNWIGDPLGLGQLSAETATEGCLDGGFLIAWPEPEAWAGHFAARTRSLIASVHAQAVKYPAALRICRTPEEVRNAKSAGRFAALIGVEGGHAIENSLGILREFHASGARYMTLTWANANDWCGSSGGGANPMGLTAFGRDVIAEMNRLGMMVDVSHVSDAAFWDVLEVSRVPVIASHSSVRHLCDAARNLTDEMALAIAARGGVVMVNFYAAFLSDAWRAAWNAQKPELLAALDVVRERFAAKGQRMPFSAEIAVDREFARRIPPVPFSVLLDHFDHLLKLVGPGHVGIGSDFDGIALSVEGMETAADLPKITAGLLERGWSPDDLRGVLGENLLRVMSAVQAAGA